MKRFLVAEEAMIVLAIMAVVAAYLFRWSATNIVVSIAFFTSLIFSSIATIAVASIFAILATENKDAVTTVAFADINIVASTAIFGAFAAGAIFADITVVGVIFVAVIAFGAYHNAVIIVRHSLKFRWASLWVFLSLTVEGMTVWSILKYGFGTLKWGLG